MLVAPANFVGRKIAEEVAAAALDGFGPAAGVLLEVGGIVEIDGVADAEGQHFFDCVERRADRSVCAT
jgi:hypothetical protein